MGSLIHKNKSKLSEEQIIGNVSSYNQYVLAAQCILKEVGFDPGRIDGKMGQQTRKAIIEFQQRRGIKPTGKIDSITEGKLDQEKEKMISFIEISSEPDASFVPTKGIPKKENRLETNNKNASKETEVQDEVLNYRLESKDKVRQMQTALRKAGFYKGKVDGKIGPQTKKAIIAFQMKKGIKADGVVNSKTWEELKNIES
ncbi:MAG: peptidoglycan-binding protein [Candidatus Omnitrophica bacterium]|nr:peptidoglycan-binding protein [Candidatus Omnitrophota bacterium]